MSVNKATLGAISFSGVTLILCLYAISVIYNDVQAIWAELDAEMDQFKVLSEDLWKDMVLMGAGTPSNRFRRQSYGGYGASGSNTGGYGGGPSLPGLSNPPRLPVGPGGPNGGPNGGNPHSNCQCKTENTCPEGPAGPAGEAGLAGLDGLPGLPGLPGKDAEDIHNEPPKGCFNCPVGMLFLIKNDLYISIQDPLDHPDLLEDPESEECADPKVLLASQDKTDCLEFPETSDLSDHLETMESPETEEKKELMLKDPSHLKELEDLPENKETKEIKDHLEKMGLPESLDPKDLPALPDLKDLWDRTERKDAKARRENPEPTLNTVLAPPEMQVLTKVAEVPEEILELEAPEVMLPLTVVVFVFSNLVK